MSETGISGKRDLIYIDEYMPIGVYEGSGICLRSHCRAEPPRDIGPPGLVPTVGWRDRAPAAYAAADRVKAPAGAARGRFRGIDGGRTTPSLPAEARTSSGGGCLAGAVPSIVVGSPGCSRAPPRSHGSEETAEKENKEKMTDREHYTPGPASGAEVRKDGEKWTLILVRELRHSPEKVWQALTDPAQLREWAPFDADRSLGMVGTTVTLTTVGAPSPHVSETTVTRADAPELLEYNWDGCCRVAHLPRCSGSPSQRNSHRPHRWSRGDEVRRLAAAERGVCQAVRCGKAIRCRVASGGEKTCATRIILMTIDVSTKPADW